MDTVTLEKLERIDDPVSVRSIDTKTRQVDIVASTAKKDRHGTIIDQDGWQLESFKKNPVILYGHEDRPSPMLSGSSVNAGLPIARALPDSVLVSENKLKMRIEFADTPFANQVFGLVQKGFINMVSVGFRPLEKGSVEDENGEEIPVYKKSELMEVSIVSIPSNDEAQIIRMADTLNRDVEEVKKELIEFETEFKAIAEEAMIKVDKEQYEKFKGYFEQKQPVNKAAGKVLKKFYKMVGHFPPDDEVEAWKHMEEELDEVEKNLEETTKILKKQVGEEQETPEPEAASEEPTPEPQPPSETPKEEAETQLHVPVDKLPALKQKLQEELKRAADEALRAGIPVEDIPRVVAKRRKALRDDIPRLLTTL